MLVDLTITNARILTKQGILEGGMAIEDGKIHTIAKPANLPRASATIDAQKDVILPGFIDAHVHLRDLQLAYKEDFFTGTCAAAAGGFTTVLDMPNTKPPTNNPSRLREKMKIAEDKIVTNVGFYTVFPSKMDEFDEIARIGAAGFKVYLSKPITELNIEDDLILLHALREAAEVKRVVAIHAEEKSIVESLEKKLKNAGETSPQAYLDAHPPKAEIKAVQRIVSLTRDVKTRLHFCHISSPRSLPLITKAKIRGIPVTCETALHYLLLSEDLVNHLGGTAIMDPPLRSRRNTADLWRAVTQKKIDIVASDHAPHTTQEKKVDDVWEVPPGIPGLETTLLLLLTRVNEGKLSLNRLTEVLALKPAQIFHLKTKALLKPGYDADLTIVNLKEKSVIDPSRFHSKAKYSPFDGWKVVGKPVKTFIGGRLVMDDGEIVAKPGSGNIIRVG